MVWDLSRSVPMMFRTPGNPLIHLFHFIFNSKCHFWKVRFLIALPIALPIVLPGAYLSWKHNPQTFSEAQTGTGTIGNAIGNAIANAIGNAIGNTIGNSIGNI